MARPKAGYQTKDGKKVPGVTTIIGRFRESGALLYWAFSQGKAAERGEISKLYDKRDEGAQAGTLAHEMVEAHIRGEELPSMIEYPVDIGRQARQGFENYLNWQNNNKIEVIKQEVSLVSEQYRFGGTPDGIGKDAQGQTCLIDWKNSSGGKAYVDYILQLAAYKQLWEENYPDRPITGGFHLCIFSKEHADFHHHHFSELGTAWEQFKLFRTAYDFDKVLKRRV